MNTAQTEKAVTLEKLKPAEKEIAEARNDR